MTTASLLIAPLRGPALRTLIPKSKPTTVLRNFSTKPLNRPTLALAPAFRQQSLAIPRKIQARFFTPSAPAYQPESNTARLLKAGAIFGGTLLGLNLLLNGETTAAQGGMPMDEREYLHSTFKYAGVGVGMIGLSAKMLHNMGWSFRLMSASPWMVLGVGLVGSLGTMIATRITPPENTMQKHLLWAAFNVTQGALLAPTFFFHPAIIARAGLYTVGMMGAISIVGATAKNDQFLWMGAPLLGGMTIVALSGLAPMVLPATSTALAISESIWLYGGLAVFGGVTLWDVQKIRQHARMATAGLYKKDPINEAISLELDFINIFIRMVQILAMRQDNRRR